MKNLLNIVLRTKELIKRVTARSVRLLSMALMVMLNVGQAWGNTVILPNNTADAGTGVWAAAGAPTAYSTSATEYNIAVGGGKQLPVTFYNAMDNIAPASIDPLQLKKNGGYIQLTVESTAGVNITVKYKTESDATLYIDEKANTLSAKNSFGDATFQTYLTSFSLKILSGSNVIDIKSITLEAKSSGTITTYDRPSDFVITPSPISVTEEFDADNGNEGFKAFTVQFNNVSTSHEIWFDIANLSDAENCELDVYDNDEETQYYENTGYGYDSNHTHTFKLSYTCIASGTYTATLQIKEGNTVKETANISITIDDAADKFTLTLNASPAAGGSPSAVSTLLATGASTNITANSANGYEFRSWEKVEGTGGSFGSTSTANTTYTMGSTNTTIQANYYLMPTITYYLTSGVSQSGTNPTSVTYAQSTGGVTINLSLAEHYTEPTASVTMGGEPLTSGVTFNSSVTPMTLAIHPASITGNLVVTANATPTYSVTYALNGGSGTMPGVAYYKAGVSVSATATIPTLSGHNFVGWKVNDTESIIQASGSFSMPAENTVLTAQWSDKTYDNYVFACAECDVTTEDSDPVLVTSRNGINIMATKKLVVSTTNAFTGHRIAISGSDLHFYKKTGTGASEHYVELVDANSLTVTGSDQEVYVSYNPTSAGDNAIASPVITVAVDGFTGDVAGLVRARNLPETMVIATKVAGSWYALPANMSSEDVQAGVLISVDETNKIAYGPATLGYKIWPVYTYPTSANDRFGLNSTPAALFGNRVRFADNRADSYKGLHNYSGNNKLNQQAVIDEITDNAGAAYEWKIATSDLDAYTLQADNTNTNYLDVYRPSSGNHKGIISWATNGDYLSNEIHFFELEEVTPVEIIPREWKSNGLIFSIAADNAISLTAGDAKYGIGDAATTDATLTRLSTGGYGLYEVSLPDLTGNYGKVLTLKLKISGSDKYATTTIPIIVSGSKSTKNNEPFSTLGTASADYDVVVLGGNTLTTDATGSGAYKFQNLCLYPGATLANTANGNLYLRHLELRAGIPSYDNLNGALAVPHLYLTKGIAGCTDGATLDMYVDVRHDYALSVPFAVSLANVKYANALKPSDGTAINGALNSQFRVSYYSAEQRATTGKGWVDITSAESYPTLSPGTGYVIQAKRPSGQPLAVLRFPFTANPTAWATSTGEVEKGAIAISGYGVDDDNISDNNKGWNLIANPYSANISYYEKDESSFVANFTIGWLEEEYKDDKWTGKYEYKEKTNAYVTIPNDNYTVYEQKRANASDVVYQPFKNFFIQASSNTGTESVTFDRNNRQQAPAIMRAAAQITNPFYVDVDLVHGSNVVTTGLTVDPDATPGYKFGEDQNIFENRNELSYLKAYTVVDGHYLVGNTLTPDELAMLIPVEFYAPDNASGYVFRINESSDLDNLESLILFDSQAGTATNLLQDDYPFTVDAAGLVEDRFTINVTLKQENNTATDVDAVDEATDKPLKFFYQQKMYILREGVIYDATGKRVREINK